MDFIIVFLYVVVFALLRNKWGFFAIVAALISCHFATHQLFFMITALCYTVLCLHENKLVSLSSLAIVTAYYSMAWENVLSDTYFLSDFVYVIITSVLNLALIISLLKSGKDGIYTTNFYGLHDNKFSDTHCKSTQGR